MIAFNRDFCQHAHTKKFGKDRKGNQRYRCLDCGKTWIEYQPRPIGDMRIPMDKAVMVLKMLIEGSSVRVTERITGVSKPTILALLVLVGERCRLFWNERMKDIPATDVQVDEIWSFVGMKEKTREHKEKSEDVGDAWCFTGMERDTRLLLTWHLGKRTPEDCRWFTDKLAVATSGKFQVTTDGYKPYCIAIVESLARRRVDFAQLIKIYGTTPGEAGKYSPGQIKGTRIRTMLGNPDKSRVCTSHAERQNLNIRTFVRRLTRLTNGFSKKWDNHESALALFFVHYNFVRIHGTLKTTPAVAAGLASKPWTVEEMLHELAEYG